MKLDTAHVKTFFYETERVNGLTLAFTEAPNLYSADSEASAQRFVRKINRLSERQDHMAVLEFWRESDIFADFEFYGLVPEPHRIRAQYQVCLALFASGQDSEAARFALRILSTRRQHRAAIKICLRAYKRQKKFSEALSFLEQSVDGVLPSAYCLSERMILLWELGETDQHKALLSKAVQVCKSNIQATIKLAGHLEHIGLTKDSRAMVQAAMINFSDDIESLTRLVKSFSRRDTFDIPFVISEQLRSMSPDALAELVFFGESKEMMRLTKFSAQELVGRFRSGQGVFRTELVSKLVVEALDHPAGAPYPSKPNIAFLIGSLRRGGAERQLSNVIRFACNDLNRFEGVSLFCNNHSLPQNQKSYYADIPTNSIDLELARPTLAAEGVDPKEAALDARWTKIIRLLPPQMSDQVEYLAKNFRSKNITVVHAWLDSMNIAACLAGLIAGVPRIILSARGLAPQRYGEGCYLQPYHARSEAWRACYRYLLKHPSVTLTHNSQAGRDSYKEWLGVDGLKMPVVYNGADLVKLETGDMQHISPQLDQVKAAYEQSFVVGSVGRFALVKRPHLWVQVAARVLAVYPDVKFLMVGDGSLLTSCLALTEKLKIRDSFTFAGEQTAVVPYLEQMDLFLMTSAREGLSNSLIEAQLTGIPSVATNVGGLSEIVIDGETGRLVPSFATAQEIADTVIGCIEDQEWMRRASTNAKREASRKFDMASSYNRWRDLYDKPNYACLSLFLRVKNFLNGFALSRDGN